MGAVQVRQRQNSAPRLRYNDSEAAWLKALSPMTQVTEAIFSQGVLKPVTELELREHQRVRLIIEPVDAGRDPDRAAALDKLLAGIASMKFSSSGPLPCRDELHDRS